MTGSSTKPEWRPSTIGITPLTIRHRPGTRGVQKFNLVGSTLPAAAGDKSNGVVIPGLDGGTRSDQTGARRAAARVCSVCTRASAEYSCPRCLIGYCSSKCYKTHGSGCTEAFFREHVKRETKLREGDASGIKGERRASMVQVLRKVRQTDNSRTSDGGGDDAGGLGEDFRAAGRGRGVYGGGSSRVVSENEENEEAGAVQERLEALALALSSRRPDVSPHPQAAAAAADTRESSVRDGRSSGGLEPGAAGLAQEGVRAVAGGPPACEQALADDEGVMALLTEEEKGRFLREVASGSLGRLILPWVPWWRQSSKVLEVSPKQWTTHSLPPRVVEPPAGLGGSIFPSNSTDTSLATEPPTPEQQQQQQQQTQPRPPPLPCASGGAAASSLGTSQAPPPATRGESAVVPGNAADEEGQEGCSRHSFASLKNLANHAPDFSTLSARPPSPALPALAVDLAYAYTVAARLYNGCWCGDPVGASLALVGASPMLRDGATPATVAQALTACVDRVVESDGVGVKSYAESLRKDVLMLCSDHRKLVCAFQDAWGMLEAAGRTLAPSKPGQPVKLKKGQRKAAKQLGKVEKRIGYFLLWARSHGADTAPAMSEAIKLAANLETEPLGLAEKGVVSLVVGDGGEEEAGSWRDEVRTPASRPASNFAPAAAPARFERRARRSLSAGRRETKPRGSQENAEVSSAGCGGVGEGPTEDGVRTPARRAARDRMPVPAPARFGRRTRRTGKAAMVTNRGAEQLGLGQNDDISSVTAGEGGGKAEGASLETVRTPTSRAATDPVAAPARFGRRAGKVKGGDEGSGAPAPAAERALIEEL